MITNEQLTKYFIRPVENQDRLDSELKVIRENTSNIDLIDYFLVLADITTWARNNNIIKGPGRGSSAGSYFAYLLGITDINPLKFNLPFSRFLSNTRIAKGSLPDIDLDFSTNRRKEILNYIFTKYGDRAAHVAIFSSMKIKMAFQDTFRALVTQPTEFQIETLKKNGDIQGSTQLANKLQKRTDDFNLMKKSLETQVPGATDEEIMHGYKDGDGNYVSGLLETNKMFADWVKNNREIFETTEKILGLPRHVGKHAGGVIISPTPLPEIVPVFKDDGFNVVAYDKKIIAKHGLTKYDILGVTALDYIQDTVDLLKKDGISLDINNLPDNPDMWEIFLDGKCSGIFQWSTSGGARFAKKLKPKCFKDLSDGVALNRPGALDANVKLSDGSSMNAADVYLKRKTGELPVEYLHPDLEPILRDTLGVSFFQENIMRIMTDLFNYTEEQADDIRSKISDKDVKAFEQVKKDAQTLLTKGWKQAQVDELYNQILAFSRYGFNAAHSVSYATLSYITAYLKFHHPLHWWASILTHSTEDEINKYWADIYQLIGSPDVNELSGKYKIRNNKLIPPISSIKGVGDSVLKEINSKGPFSSLEDFFAKTSRRIINVGIVQKLTIAGAFDTIINKEFFSPEAKLRYVFAMLKKNDKDNFPEKFQSLTPYEWYLELKRILPASPASLYQAVKKTPEIKMPFITKDLGENVFASALRGKYVLVNGKGLNSLLQEMSGMDNGTVEVCAYGYVKSLRRFSYKNNTKNAIEINIDFDHFPCATVIWANWEEREPECNGYLLDKEAYLFTLRVSGKEGKEIQVTKVNKILIDIKKGENVNG